MFIVIILMLYSRTKWNRLEALYGPPKIKTPKNNVYSYVFDSS